MHGLINGKTDNNGNLSPRTASIFIVNKPSFVINLVLDSSRVKAIKRAALFSFCMAECRLQSVFNSPGSSCALFMVATAVNNCPITIWGKNSTPQIQGMMIALPPEDWSDLGTMSQPQFSSLLQDWGRKVKLEAFTSTKRKPKKKKLKPPYDPRHPHVSTARLLAQKKQSRACLTNKLSRLEGNSRIPIANQCFFYLTAPKRRDVTCCQKTR